MHSGFVLLCSTSYIYNLLSVVLYIKKKMPAQSVPVYVKFSSVKLCCTSLIFIIPVISVLGQHGVAPSRRHICPVTGVNGFSTSIDWRANAQEMSTRYYKRVTFLSISPYLCQVVNMAGFGFGLAVIILVTQCVDRLRTIQNAVRKFINT